MDLPVIEATIRTETGKENARKVRNDAMIPAICYGPSLESLSIVCDPRPIKKVIMSRRGVNTLVALKVDGEPQPRRVFIKDYQIHPVKRRLLHCDFYQVDESREVTMNVPVVVVGKSVGEKAGGRLHKVLRTIKLRSRVADIPESVEVDVSELSIGEQLKISDIEIPEGCQSLYRLEHPVVVINAARGIEELEEAEEEEVEEEAATEEESED
jgi:large subunit ribosomal protein L25